ncbi:hypothetical protein PUN28_015014 [Cardiocondyla obscurior]|uniref:Uncharacterized protein n=1 Tax=Cardiocondyla obscurior TaxID=286306 RepID=A0AAW2F2G6_9HYME
MRRTRHVVLPVRSWQYIGLLIVSLACLTLGLVARDREGHAGSLAGPELTHQAPHEVDACPNLNPFVKKSIAELEEAAKLINDDVKISEPKASAVSRKSVLSRSLSLDRVSRSGSREVRKPSSENRGLRIAERVSRSRVRASDNRSANRVWESRLKRNTQFRDTGNTFSRSRDLSRQALSRRSAERNSERRLIEPANSRFDDHRSRSTERVLNYRAEIHERTSRSVERRTSPENRNAEQQRNNNLNRRNREGSLNNRRALHYRTANRERTSGLSAVRDTRRALVKSDDRRTLSRLAERRNVNDLNREALNRQIRTARSEERVVTLRGSSENSRRERINRSRETASRRDVSENYRTARSRHEEIASRERRERIVRSSRSVDRNSMDRREIRRIKDSGNRDRQSRDERRIALQNSREAERRAAEQRNLIRRVSERQDALNTARFDSRKLSERRTDNARSRQEFSAIDRRLERNSESRVSRDRTVEKRSALNSRRLSTHEGSRMQNRRVERNSELRNSISMFPMERRTNSRTASLGNQVLRSSETQRENRRAEERRVTRSFKDRLTEFRERESRHLHQRRTRSIENSSRFSSRRRVYVPEQSHEQRRLSVEKMLARTVDNERLSTKWERSSRDVRVEKNVGAEKKIVLNPMDYKYVKQPMVYDLMRQALVMALCTVYGLSLYNGKKSSIGSNIMQQAQRLIIW